MSQASSLESLLPDHWTPILDYLYDVHVYRLALSSPRIAQRVRLGLKTLHLAFSSLQPKKLSFWPSLTDLTSHSAMDDWTSLALLPSSLKSFYGGYISGKLGPQRFPIGLQHISVVAPFVSWSVISALPPSLLTLKIYECQSFNDDMGAMLPRNLQTFHLLSREPHCCCGGPRSGSSTSAVTDMLFRDMPVSMADIRVETSGAFSELALVLSPPNVTRLQLTPLYMNESSYASIPPSVTDLKLIDVRGHITLPSHYKDLQDVTLTFPGTSDFVELEFSNLVPLLSPRLRHLWIEDTSKFDCFGEWTAFPALQVLKLPFFSPDIIPALPRQLRVLHCFSIDPAHKERNAPMVTTFSELPRSLTDIIYPIANHVDATQLCHLPPGIIRCALDARDTSTDLSFVEATGNLAGELNLSEKRAYATIESAPRIPLNWCEPPLFEMLASGEPVRFIGVELKDVSLSRYLLLAVRQILSKYDFESRIQPDIVLATHGHHQKPSCNVSDATASSAPSTALHAQALPQKQCFDENLFAAKIYSHTGNIVDICRHCHFPSHISFRSEALQLTHFERENMQSLSVTRTLLCGKKPLEKVPIPARSRMPDVTPIADISKLYDEDEDSADEAQQPLEEGSAMDVSEPSEDTSPILIDWNLDETSYDPSAEVDDPKKPEEGESESKLQIGLPLEFPLYMQSLALVGSGRALTKEVCATLPDTLTSLKVFDWKEKDDISSLTQLSHLCLTHTGSPFIAYRSIPSSITCLALPNCVGYESALEVVDALQDFNALPHLSRLSISWTTGDDSSTSDYFSSRRSKSSSPGTDSKSISLINAFLAELEEDAIAKLGKRVKEEKKDIKGANKKPTKSKKIEKKDDLHPDSLFTSTHRLACYCILRLLKHPKMVYLAIGNDFGGYGDLFSALELLQLVTPHIVSPLRFVSLSSEHFVQDYPEDEENQGQNSKMEVDNEPVPAPLTPQAPRPASERWRKLSKKRARTGEEKDETDHETTKRKKQNEVALKQQRTKCWLRTSPALGPIRSETRCLLAPPCDPPSTGRDLQLEDFNLLELFTTPHPQTTSSADSSDIPSSDAHTGPINALRLYQNTKITSGAFSLPEGQETLRRLLEYGPAPLDLLSHLVTLVVLRNDSFKDETISRLPRTLTELTLASDTLSDACVDHLPPGLVTLIFTRTNLITDASISRLPRTITHLSLPTSTLLSDECVSGLPSGLKKLNLQSNVKFTNVALSALPRSLVALHLTFWRPQAGSVSDEGMSRLPPGLTELWMNFNSTITSGCFSLLPRSLLILSVSALTIVRADHISYLPPYLHRLHLNSVTLSTLEEFSALPKTISRLRLAFSDNAAAIKTVLPLLKFDTGFGR